MEAIEAGAEDAWELIPWSMAPSDYNNRVIAVLPNGDMLVWAGYADYPDLYAIRYIGPADEFHSPDISY